MKKDTLLKLNFLKIYNGNLYPIIRKTEVIFTETGDVKVSSSQFKIDDNFANKFYANNQYAFLCLIVHVKGYRRASVS